ncbi:MAG: hypothetical protein AB2637_12160 [Candidatus Thiodiazotropha sp.]
MICKFCTNDRKLIKAHVIPAGFFKRLRSGKQAPKMLTNTPGEFPKKSPVGVYDAKLVCRACEDQFGDWDDYAQQLLKGEPSNGKKLFSGKRLVGYEVPTFEYAKMKLFFISLLWRASASSHSFYRRISLGPFERRAKEMIENQDPGSPEEFSVVLAKFDDELGTCILDPHPEKWDGVNYVRFYLSGYVAYVKVDKRKAPLPHARFILSERQPLYIIARNLRGSKEFPLMKKITNS